ncbi:MAG: DUF2207 domain-containing protein, partial [Alphaproteobacteria bacterium]|nr:DUF2207 domain-containing protein [Alphaproteobacteria bacterium]
ASDPVDIKPVDFSKLQKETKRLYEELPDINDKKAIQKYLEKRIKITTIANINENEIATPSSTSIVNLDELKKKQEKTLSAYDKIYQDSLNRAKDMNSTINEDLELQGRFYRPVEHNEEPQKFIPDFPYVMVKLSDEREIMAPAEEHIAYMLSTINIAPTGLVDLTEEFIIVSNNETFPQGFFRILPKFSCIAKDECRRIDLTLKSVTINGEEHPYKITENGNKLYIEPKKPINIPTGIYTYRFNYLIDRLIWNHDDFDEMYWDLTAKTLINVVGSANAVVILPSGETFMGQNAIVSTTKNDILPNRATIAHLSENAIGIADTEALAQGDDLHIYIALEKGTLTPPDFSKKYSWFIQDYGVNLFALLALIAIFISYKVSSVQMRKNLDKTQVKLKKTPSIFRILNSNIYDVRSFGAELLNLYAKNVVDLNSKENTAVLIKKTDDLKKLSKTEQKLMNILFPNTETVLPANKEAKLKLLRAYKYLQLNTIKTFSLYKLRLNALYLLFSLGMLTFGIICSSYTAVNPLHTFLVIISCTIIIFLLIVLFNYTSNNKYLALSLKTISVFLILFISGLLNIYTSKIYAVIIILTILLIISYYKLFSRRSGLLKNKIKETEEYKTYLTKNTDIEMTKKDFKTKLPYIFAFGIEDKYQGVDCFEQINLFLNQLKNKD